MMFAAKMAMVVVFWGGASAFQVALRPSEHRVVRVRGWGGEVAWSPCEVVSNDEAGEGLRAMALKVSEEKGKAYKTPGQFVQLKSGDSKPGFFAIASPPPPPEEEEEEDPASTTLTLEFLIKATDGNGWLTEAAAGQELDMSDVAGKGYDLDEWEGEEGKTDPKYDGFGCFNYVFLAQGTGIAPIRATIETGITKDLQKPATLIYGVRDSKHAAYADKFDAWRTDFNVNVVEVHSRPEKDWTGPRGYVQDILKRTRIDAPRNTGAIVCGNKDFFVANKEYLASLGIFEDRILTNF